jgi:hypothetical protein
MGHGYGDILGGRTKDSDRVGLGRILFCPSFPASSPTFERECAIGSFITLMGLGPGKATSKPKQKQY